MGDMKWQRVLAILLISMIGGVVTLSGLFGSLFNLKGVSYDYTGDIYCDTDCESYINVTTSYWRVCFDHYNDTKYSDEVLFKKVSTSRTLHVNLDKVDDVISTNPEIPVDWLVPAVGKDNWRPVKDGDCWERGKVNRIKLVGEKNVFDTVKWGFDAGDYVIIDPEWIANDVGDFKPVSKDGFVYENNKGDVVESIGRPSVNNGFEISKWGGEAVFGVNLPLTNDDNMDVIGDKVVVHNNDFDYYFFNVNNTFEFQIGLINDLHNDTVSFIVNLSGVNCYYQPPMNELYPSKWSNETSGFDSKGNIIAEYVDESFVGSYACFGNNNGNVYGDGGAFTIYRNWINDSHGEFSYCNQTINDGVWNITCPQELMVRGSVIGPAVGIFVPGTNGVFYHEINYQNITMPEDGTLDSITFKATSFCSPHVYAAIYSDNTSVPGSLIEESVGSAIPGGWSTGAWYTLDMLGTTSLSSGTKYWLAVVDTDSSSSGCDRLGYTYMGYLLGNYEEAGTSFPSTATPVLGDYVFSIYANYTVGGEPPAQDFGPNITLHLPANATSSGNLSYDFVVEVADDVQGDNVTLYVWHDNNTVFNTSINTSTFTTAVNVTFTVPGFLIDTYYWNAFAIDNNSNSSWADNNFTLTVAGADSCSNCDGTNNCYWDCSDDCVIIEDIDMNGYNISIIQTTSGSHRILLNANITNYGGLTSFSGYDSGNKCTLQCGDGCFKQ